MADNKKYDTPLNAKEKAAYDKWVKDQSAKLGYNFANTRDYDMQGWFKQNGPQDLVSGAHFTDQYKKPNHPTFSTDSQYSNEPGVQAGVWHENGDGSWDFIPGATNLKTHSKTQLEDYFKNEEGPDVNLIIRDPSASMYPTMGQKQN